MKLISLIIDVREPAEFKQSHVKGAINIPLTKISSSDQYLKDISKDSELILYCNSGNRSLAAVQLLSQKGFTKLKNGINETTMLAALNNQ